METIIIMGLDGPAVSGTEWLIREGQQELEQVGTRQEAIDRARNKWAAPGQEIRLVNTVGSHETIRREDPSKQPQMRQHSGGGLFF